MTCKGKFFTKLTNGENVLPSSAAYLTYVATKNKMTYANILLCDKYPLRGIGLNCESFIEVAVPIVVNFS